MLAAHPHYTVVEIAEFQAEIKQWLLGKARHSPFGFSAFQVEVMFDAEGILADDLLVVDVDNECIQFEAHEGAITTFVEVRFDEGSIYPYEGAIVIDDVGEFKAYGRTIVECLQKIRTEGAANFPHLFVNAA